MALTNVARNAPVTTSGIIVPISETKKQFFLKKKQKYIFDITKRISQHCFSHGQNAIGTTNRQAKASVRNPKHSRKLNIDFKTIG